MTFFSQHRKIILVALLVFVLTGGIFVLNAPKAHAAWSLIDVPLTVVYTIILGVLEVIRKFFGAFLSLAANILEGVLSLTTFTKAPVVIAGWTLTRGLCNMFLALILLIMAVATILQIESFSAKRLLPRLVIVALLINFSLLFAGIIIDFSQVLTNYFINAAKGNSSISEQISAGLSMGNAFNGDATTVAAPPGFCVTVALPNGCPVGQVCQALGVGTGTYGCAAPADPNTTKDVAQGDPGTLNVIIGAIFAIILTVIATFIILAAALLFLFRIVALWLLLILSPLALVAWITGTGNLWNKWVSSFFKWTFFAPVYAFFIYLAILSVSAVNVATTFKGAKFGAQATVLNSIANSPALILQYVTVAIILVGGLIAAQSLGIAGAGAVMAWGKKAGKATGKWTVRKGTGYDAWSPKLMAAGGAIVGTIPGFGKTGAIMKGKAEDMKEKQLQRRENVLLEKFIRKLPESEVNERVEKDRGVNGLIASRVANEKGYLKNANDATVKKAMATFRNFGMQKELLQLQEIRSAAVEDPVEREQARRRSLDSGSYKNLSAAALEGDGGKELVEWYRKNMSRGSFISWYNGLIQSAKGSAKIAMRGNFNDNFTDNNELNRRDLYAAATDNIVQAYSTFTNPADDRTGTITTSVHGQQAMATHVQSRNAAQLAAVGPGAGDIPDMERLGAHITRDQMRSIRTELSDTQKKHIIAGAQKYGNLDAIDENNNNPMWQV